MKILLFGLGSIGKRHAKLLKKHFKHELFAFRHKKGTVKNTLGIKEIYDLKEIDNISPDIAFITNPTCDHMKYATYCAKRGIDLFIEKPISHSTKGLSTFVSTVKKSKSKVYIAYCLRFHPCIIWLKKHINKNNKPLHVNVNASSNLADWRKGVDHIRHYSASKDMGGGVVLELSHEIDYLYYLFGAVENIKVNAKKIGNVTADAEDFADMLMESKKGVFINVHVNFLSKMLRREIIVDFKDHTVVLDLIKNSVNVIRDKKNIKKVKFDIERDDIYLEQLKYFFKNFKKAKMMNDLTESRKVFDIIMKVKRSVK